jgi:GT2 family glycosyltransferase
MVSVVVVNWNGKHLLPVCLASLDGQRYRDLEVILVDNGSRDGSADYVRQVFPHVRVLALAENVGFAAGNNAGLEVAQGDLVALLNNDAVAQPDWLLALVAAMETRSEIGFCASSLLDFEQRAVFDSAGLGYSRHGIAYRKLQGQTFNLAALRAGPTFAACGGAMMIRRSVLDTVGLFDADLYMYGEDVDLCFRSQLFGRPGWYVPEAIVYHKQSATSRTAQPAHRWTRMRVRNQWWVFLKNMPAPLLVRSIPYALYGFVRHAAANLLTRTLGAYLAGFCDAWKAWPQIRLKRQQVAAFSRVTWQALDAIIESNYPYHSLLAAARTMIVGARG